MYLDGELPIILVQLVLDGYYIAWVFVVVVGFLFVCLFFFVCLFVFILRLILGETTIYCLHGQEPEMYGRAKQDWLTEK